MSSFILEEHRETYNIFYREVTGKSLPRVSLGLATSGLKRKEQGVSKSSKEEPKIKKPKTDQQVMSTILRLVYVVICVRLYVSHTYIQQGSMKFEQCSNPIPSNSRLSTSKHLNNKGIN